MTNAERVARIAKVIKKHCDPNDPHTQCVDMLADVIHFALAHDVDIHDAWDTARNHVKWERYNEQHELDAANNEPVPGAVPEEV